MQREPFDKLGMRRTTLQFDAAGTPIGSSHLWAPARDWAAEPMNRPYLNALRARSAWARASARGKSLRSLSIVSGFIQ